MSRPSWNKSYGIELIDHDKMLLYNDLTCRVLRGRAFPILAELLDGETETPEIVKKGAERIFDFELYTAIDLGLRRGFLVDGRNHDPEQAPFWNALNVSQESAEAALARTHVAIVAHPTLDRYRNLASRCLAELHIPVVETEEEADLLLVLTDDYLDAAHAERNDRALSARKPWMIVRPIGNTVWIGPLFRPGATGCWSCLAQRLRSNQLIEHFLERRGTGRATTPQSSRLSGIGMTAVSLAVTEMAKALACPEEARGGGRLLTYDAVTGETARHTLVKRPQCPDCGAPRSLDGEPRPVVLAADAAYFRHESGSRTMPPEETLERLEHHISPLTGVVRTLERFGNKGSRGLLHSYAAGHNFALMHMDVAFALENVRGRSGGKGTNDTQAKVGAVCEAIERYSALYRGDAIVKRASHAELDETALHPNSVMLFSEAQYANRKAWNAANPAGFHQVPLPFDNDRKIDWTPLWSLLHQRHAWIPTAYCYFGHPDLREWFFCTSDSNGNAAGNTLEEAVLQGFLELVERDAVAVFWYNKIVRPGIDLDSFGIPYLADLQDYYRSIGRTLWAIDLTHDLGIPVIAGISARTEGPAEDIVVGFGAHLDPAVALMRAMTEVNQFMPAVQNRDSQGNTIYWFHEPTAIDWWKTGRFDENPHLVPARGLPLRKKDDFSSVASGDLGQDLAACMDILRRNDLDLLVLDQSQADIELNAVKVIVPGLRHFWKRFGAGRLYDVPVQLGWREAPTPESELNPVGIFF